MTDQEIEDFLAEKVMGWKWTRCWGRKYWEPDGGYDEDWHPLSNIAQAWRVLEKCIAVDGPFALRTAAVSNGISIPVITMFKHRFNNADLWACSAQEAAREICEIAVECVSATFAQGER